MKFRVLITTDEDGVFIARALDLPGCVSQGKTRSEALENIKEAISSYMASLRKHGEPAPPHLEGELIEVNA